MPRGATRRGAVLGAAASAAPEAGRPRTLFLRDTSLWATRPSQALVLARPLVSKVPCLAGNTPHQEPFLPAALCSKPEGRTAPAAEPVRTGTRSPALQPGAAPRFTPRPPAASVI